MLCLPPRGAPGFPHPPQGLHPHRKEVRQQPPGPPRQQAARGHRQALWASHLKSLGHSRARPLLWGHGSGQGALGCQGCGGEPGAHGGFCRPGKAGLPVADLLLQPGPRGRAAAPRRSRGLPGLSSLDCQHADRRPHRGPGRRVSAGPVHARVWEPLPLVTVPTQQLCSSLPVCQRFVLRKTLESWQHCKTSRFVESQGSSKTYFFL